MIAKTPKTPYFAVIFTSVRKPIEKGYSEMALAMEKLVLKQEGFLGYESAKSDIGITISYWENLEAIKNWKFNSEHATAREKGKEVWYDSFKVRICKVERDYEF